MKTIPLLFLLGCSILTAKPIAPESVAILYNNQIPESEALARHYAKARNIPRSNLVGLELSSKDEITREEYNSSLRDPIRALFVSRGWWKMAKTKEGKILPGQSKITTLVSMRGVPFKIKRQAVKQTGESKLPKHFAQANEAAVDSELAMVGVHDLPTLGPINNPYFKKESSISEAKLPFLLLVGRIDGPSYKLCKRLISDAAATEKRGLWGMAYIDLAKKGGGYVAGDQWMENIGKLNRQVGIPTAIDRNKQTFTTNYPMSDAAIYYGWYTTNFNGPLLNPHFNFRRGAVAVHLHSYSASHLRNAKSRWTGPILEKGAAATVGNVYEPYLHLTHHLDIFHDRLLKGYSLVEAAYMANPALSWQALVLGDPLYRPFIHFEGGGEKDDFDRDYRAIRMANQIWKDKPETMVKKLRTKAAELGNATLYEYLGLWHREQKQNEVAIAFFQTASKKHMLSADRLRQWIYTADIHRQSGNKVLAIETLKKAKLIIPQIPESQSVTALLNILDPPPPPPAQQKANAAKP
ncbi:TIGR03790 family protein [Verrucomicrobiaceae bacterium N1E253]|uniref:TIGR03790 family protein n=1 Tax=Oceaniferula marina TaxID=2748318 RepID=A0A851GFG4_9BACT|nr:TIGR03790 family protein [Oceaniferula marina]NWK54491.1 TIGR03790 family protein [Oceaniferula marina]